MIMNYNILPAFTVPLFSKERLYTYQELKYTYRKNLDYLRKFFYDNNISMDTFIHFDENESPMVCGNGKENLDSGFLDGMFADSCPPVFSADRVRYNPLTKTWEAYGYTLVMNVIYLYPIVAVNWDTDEVGTYYIKYFVHKFAQSDEVAIPTIGTQHVKYFMREKGAVTTLETFSFQPSGGFVMYLGFQSNKGVMSALLQEAICERVGIDDRMNQAQFSDLTPLILPNTVLNPSVDYYTT